MRAMIARPEHQRRRRAARHLRRAAGEIESARARTRAVARLLCLPVIPVTTLLVGGAKGYSPSLPIVGQRASVSASVHGRVRSIVLAWDTDTDTD